MLVEFKIGCYVVAGPNEADMSCVVVEPRMGTVVAPPLQPTCLPCLASWPARLLHTVEKS